MDELDRCLLDRLQDGLPVCEEPWAELAAELAQPVPRLLERVQAMLDDGRLSRFGPMYRADRLGGGLTLAALAVPAERFDEVNDLVNALPEVAHNYEREHDLNMWFVVATATPAAEAAALARIEAETGLPVYAFPKEREFFVGLKVPV